jgi:4-amino-4-deoxy-L-arabinose transferase-like glycosyltransferase
MQQLDASMSSERVERSLGDSIRGLADEYGLIGTVLLAAITHAFNMFHYPLYLGDEGIYLEQAWAVLRLGQLAPYTYFYDHAPAGWLLIALWEFLLPRQFLTFGMAINSARVFMLLLDSGSTALLYRVARHMTGSHFAAIASAVAFTLSPLEIYYQRMVLLDNIMVFWLLLSFDLMLTESRRIMPLLASGFCFGVATLCKENSIFFLPVLGYVLYHKVQGTYRARFSIVGWSASAAMLISLYPVYALLKGEFFPAGSEIVGSGAPAAHVSLISTVLWQMSRHGGSILDPNSQFWSYFWGKWWIKDPIIIVVGAAATAINLLIGLSDRERHRYTLVASLMSIAFTIYLIRGSVMIDFYVVPVLPFFALNVGLLLSRLAHAPPRLIGATLATVALVAMAVGFVAQSHDTYLVDQTSLQIHQLAFIRQNVPANAMVLIDDDLWVDLHEPNGNQPVYPLANSHWKIAADPAIRDKLLHDRWQSLDYLVMSNKLHYIFGLNNEQLALDAYNHSRLLARFEEGDVELEVRQVIKPEPSS